VKATWVLLGLRRIDRPLCSAPAIVSIRLEAGSGARRTVPFLAQASFPARRDSAVAPHGSGLPRPTLSGADEQRPLEGVTATLCVLVFQPGRQSSFWPDPPPGLDVADQLPLLFC